MSCRSLVRTVRRVWVVSGLSLDLETDRVSVFIVYFSKNVGVVTSYKAQKPASTNFGFIIHIRCAIRLCVLSLAINDVTLFN